MSFHTDKSPFWRYCRDRLALPFITHVGALAALVHGICRYADDTAKDMRWLQAQFLPPKADEALIPLYGESRGVARTRFDSNHQFRLRVERAFAWHRLGPRETGMPRILREYGFSSCRIVNARDRNPDLYAHFSIFLLKPPADFAAEDVDRVFALANQYKPGRSVLDWVQFGMEQRAVMFLGACNQSTVIVDHFVKAKEALPPQPAPLCVGAALHHFVTIEHRVAQSWQK